jgi:hypothetical protein
MSPAVRSRQDLAEKAMTAAAELCGHNRAISISSPRRVFV